MTVIVLNVSAYLHTRASSCKERGIKSRVGYNDRQLGLHIYIRLGHRLIPGRSLSLSWYLLLSGVEQCLRESSYLKRSSCVVVFILKMEDRENSCRVFLVSIHTSLAYIPTSKHLDPTGSFDINRFRFDIRSTRAASPCLVDDNARFELVTGVLEAPPKSRIGIWKMPQ
jgi:hypothetical protein